MIAHLALLGNSRDLYVRTMYSQLPKHLHYDLYIQFILATRVGCLILGKILMSTILMFCIDIFPWDFFPTILALLRLHIEGKSGKYTIRPVTPCEGKSDSVFFRLSHLAKEGL